MEKGNLDGARIHAETAIREKNQAQNYLRLSGRIGAVCQRVETAVRMQAVTKNMSGVVVAMDDIMKETMDVSKLTKIMDKFEQQFEDMDIASKTMENSMQSSMAVSTPENEVDSLMQLVADEHGLEFEAQLDGIGVVRPKAKTVEQAAPAPKETISVGAHEKPPKAQNNQNGKKKGDDDEDEEGDGGLGAAFSSLPPARGGAGNAAEDDLEARLRRLQGM